MNKARRRDIERAAELIEQAKAILETAEGEEREYFDAMPENMQGGDKGQKAETAADALQEAVDSLSEAADKCTEAGE